MSRSARITFALLVVGLLVSLVWLVHPWFDPANDASMYILTARSLLAGEGYSMLGGAFRIRPPGFTAMIAPILALRGTDFYALNLFVSLFGVAGVALLFLFVRERLGSILALCVSVVVWLNPGYQGLCNQTMSDVPGTTMLIGCLLLERWAARGVDSGSRLRRDVLLGVVIALSAYVRTVDILLVPAILGMRVVRKFMAREEPRESWGGLGRGALAMLLAAALVQAPWNIRNAAVAPEPPADQTLLYSYGTGMFHEDMGDPDSRRLEWSEIFGRFPKRGGQALGVLGSRMTDNETGAAGVALFLIGCTLIVLVKRRESNELFLIGTLAIISVYFGFANRLLLPIYVLALPAAAEVVRDLGQFLLGRFAGKHAGQALAVAGLCAVLALDYAPRHDWKKIENRHLQLEHLTGRFEEVLEPDAVIASTRAWHYAVMMDRQVFALEFAIKRFGRPDALESIVDKYPVNTIVVTKTRAKDHDVIRYLDKRYRNLSGDAVARVYRVR